jgi:hypothetical protein
MCANAFPWKYALAHELNSTSTQEERRNVVKRYAEIYSRTEKNIYETARRHGWNSGRKKRSDKGTTSLTEQQITMLAGMGSTTARELKGPIMPTKLRYELMVSQGYLDPEEVTYDRACAILRERNLDKKGLMTPEPTCRMRSLHPNHVWLFDGSICVVYHMEKKGMSIMDESDFYKNKLSNYAKIKLRVIRMTAVDHFSGMIFVKYYLADGENTGIIFDFLCSTFEDKGPGMLYGVPFLILCDAGSWNMSKPMMSFYENMNIELPPGMPKRKTRQGAVEVAHNLVETWFESRLRIQPAATVEQLNEWAIDWAIGFNADPNRVHSRHQMTRAACWSMIKANELRTPPERDLMEYSLSYPAEERQVKGDYTITYRDRIYSVRQIQDIVPNLTKVKVILKPLMWPGITVSFDGADYTCRPVPVVEGGFLATAGIIGKEYKSVQESSVQKARKLAENYAYGEAGEPKKHKDRQPYAGMIVMGNEAQKMTVAYLSKPETPAKKWMPKHTDLAESIADQQMPIFELIKMINKAGIAVTPEINKKIYAQFGKTISSGMAERIVEALKKSVYPCATDIDMACGKKQEAVNNG